MAKVPERATVGRYRSVCHSISGSAPPPEASRDARQRNTAVTKCRFTCPMHGEAKQHTSEFGAEKGLPPGPHAGSHNCNRGGEARPFKVLLRQQSAAQESCPGGGGHPGLQSVGPSPRLHSPRSLGAGEDYGVLRAHAGEEGSGDDHGTAKTTLSSSLGKCRPPQTCSRHCSPHEPKEAPATTPGRHSQHIPWCAPFSAVREERPVPRCLSGTSIQCEFQPELIHLPPGP
ncbi:unnamed protein product [Rangifer tarandus platyrhynchus]|uniref:Uncharacterized protein n=2 Tax=Rangifer tarandus platyrhynchus TaxID=3082113 RepID=A0ABN8YWS7_RANTA|nr:unnamed protein product [Rangifer tarandus platyrhynchus]CAI9703045.1 unnamed protein product [Rangifer tarandus platyrhynchus]